MLYRKNVPNWERAMRLAAGAIMIAVSFLILPRSPLAYIVAAMGAMIVLTGFIGCCPMCSIAGRRLPEKPQP
jgi:hypothetical protein